MKSAAFRDPLKSGRPDAARRGSALVMALVIVVLMVIMGASYLQMARLDRRATFDTDTRSNTDDDSILRWIGRTIIGPDVPMQFDGYEAGTYPEMRDGDVDIEEVYDYPWTNTAGSTVLGAAVDPSGRNQWYNTLSFGPIAMPGPIDGATINSVEYNSGRRPGSAVPDASGRFYAFGGWGDDPWLAGIRPINKAGTDVWPHLTNLTGVFLDFSATVTDAETGYIVPRQWLSQPNPADANAPFNTNVDVPLALMQNDLVNNGGDLFGDADGDGIADSRWTWAPLPIENGKAYVMAVRIIDNSALINLNAWTAPRAATAADAPRWLWPGELDVRSIFLPGAPLHNANLSGRNLGDDVLTVKRNHTINSGTVAFTERLPGWVNYARAGATTRRDDDQRDALEKFGSILEKNAIIGSLPYPSYSIPAPGEDFSTGSATTPGAWNTIFPNFNRRDELELRWKNGLNRLNDSNSAVFAPTPLENLGGGVLSAYFRQASLETVFNNVPGVVTEMDYFNFSNEPRKWLTLTSGAAEYGKIEPASLNPYSLADGLGDALSNLGLEGGPTGDNTPEVFKALNYTAKAVSDSVLQEERDLFFGQLSACLTDYIDDDSSGTAPVLTGVRTEAGDVAYGMEHFPAISEAYIQGRYVATITDDISTTPPTSVVTWNLDGFTVIIEMVNPWPYPIAFPGGFRLYVTNGDGASEDWGTLDALTNDTVQTLSAFERVIIRVNSNGGSLPASVVVPTHSPAADPVSTTAAGTRVPAATTQTLSLPANDSNPGTNTYVLQLIPPVEVYSGTGEVSHTAVLQRFPIYELPQTVTDHYDQSLPPVPASGSDGFLNSISTGTANGLSALAVRFQDVVVTLPPAWTPPPPSALHPTNPDPDPSLNVVWPNADNTISTQFNTYTKNTALGALVSDDLEPGVSGLSNGEPWTIPNAGRLNRAGEIARLVIAGPRERGGTVETVADVLQDAGTTPIQIADFMLDPADTARIGDGDMQVTYLSYLMHRFTTLARESNLATVVPGRININTMPVGFLQYVLPTQAAWPTGATETFITNYRDDPATRAGYAPGFPVRPNPGLTMVTELPLFSAGYLNLVVDFNETDDGFGPHLNPSNDRFSGDREELSLFMTYLNQVLTTRSDVYTVYVHVREYDVNDFSTGFTNEYWLTAIMDRSELRDSGMPRIVAATRRE